MNILVLGSEYNFKEVSQKFGVAHSYFHFTNTDVKQHIHADVAFDFIPNSEISKRLYQTFKFPIFINTAFDTLSSVIIRNEISTPSFGFCGLDTFVNRQILEVCIADEVNANHLKSICDQLGTEFVCVKDQVGMITPRVICMIINEAYMTLEEGISDKSDIDIAMKLGTNYPYGPFEWAEKIGLKNVVNLLDAVYHASKDSRYLVNPLLRNESIEAH
jgi:3-hydroxybutyryl-CoA dehydrogenase